MKLILLRKRQVLKTAILMLLSILLFLWGSERQASLVNLSMHSTDQSAYMHYAKELARTDFAFVGGRNRMPLYPALISLFYTDGMTDEEFFERGKRVGIALGIIVLALVFVIFRWSGHIEDALTVTLVAMFTIFAYKSPYFQPEVLFYGIGLLLFGSLLELIRRPNLSTAVLAGCVGGVAHLTKASVLPSLLLASACLVARTVSGLCQRRRRRNSRDEGNASPYSTVLLPLSCSIVLISLFLLIVSPYILTSKERFGRYFYNVNSTFYMWYDSWAEAKEGTRSHGDRFAWPDMPEEEIPSLSRYLQDHSFTDIAGRFAFGFAAVSGISIFLSFGSGPFLLLYFAITAMFFSQYNDWELLKRLWKENCLVIIFAAGYFAGYMALYAWYVPIARGNRFPLTLFLPAMLLCLRSFSHFRRNDMSIRIFGRNADVAAINRTILLLLGVYLLAVFPWLVSTAYGGW